MTNKLTFCLISILSLSACNSSETTTEQPTNPSTNNAVQATELASSNTPDTDTPLNVDNASDNDTLKDGNSDKNDLVNYYDPQKIIRPNISQQFVGTTPTQIRLAYALPELPYDTDALPDNVHAINTATWSQDAVIDEALTIKIQALLNYHHHSVGAVDGRYGQNVIKAIEVFQQKNDLPVTAQIDTQTWQALTADDTLKNMPVLVHYTLRQEDIDIPYHPKGQQFHSVTEAVAEKFHMSQGLLTRLNPNTKLKAGNTIVVYNPHQPNAVPIHRVVANKAKNLLFAYDKDDNLVASYPTTMGSSYKPSPNGNYKVLNRVIDPTYNKDFSNKNSVLPPGPNNPVGRVWIGINKPSYGIHGSPNPEKISQQKSSGCVRLTNWDALGLFGTIEIGAMVEFK